MTYCHYIVHKYSMMKQGLGWAAYFHVFLVITFNIEIKQRMYCIKIKVRIVQANHWRCASHFLFLFFFFHYYYSETVDLLFFIIRWLSSNMLFFSATLLVIFSTTFCSHRSDCQVFLQPEFDSTILHSGLEQVWSKRVEYHILILSSLMGCLFSFKYTVP